MAVLRVVSPTSDREVALVPSGSEINVVVVPVAFDRLGLAGGVVVVWAPAPAQTTAIPNPARTVFGGVALVVSGWGSALLVFGKDPRALFATFICRRDDPNTDPFGRIFDRDVAGAGRTCSPSFDNHAIA